MFSELKVLFQAANWAQHRAKHSTECGQPSTDLVVDSLVAGDSGDKVCETVGAGLPV